MAQHPSRGVLNSAQDIGLFVQFSYLQMLDVLTTLVFLTNGIGEANPLADMAIGLGPSPLAGLLGLKVLAVLLAVYCLHSGRQVLLTRINVFFAALVTWNLIAIIIGSSVI